MEPECIPQNSSCLLELQRTTRDGSCSVKNIIYYFIFQVPEGHRANGIIVSVVDGQGVKGFIPLFVWVLILLLRELTVIQETRVIASLRWTREER